jgi:hypothetical protein
MSGPTTVHEATEDDIAAVEALLRSRASDPRSFSLSQEPGRRHVLVLDAPDGGLAAAAIVEIEGERGQLVMLVVASRFEATGLEARMIGVAEALCEAFGARTMDVSACRAA